MHGVFGCVGARDVLQVHAASGQQPRQFVAAETAVEAAVPLPDRPVDTAAPRDESRCTWRLKWCPVHGWPRASLSQKNSTIP